jgi:hypothetical protein
MKKVWAIRLLSLAMLWLAVLGSGTVRADSWAMPETKTILSDNGQFRFTVTPAEIGSQLAYFREEVAAEKSGQPVERPAPLGLLEKRDAKGKWEPVWAGPLANPVAPVSVLVADDGRHIVTFDNWHSLGHGDHVIVIYGAEGALVRSLRLTDLVPEDYMIALPRSVSSIYWSKDERFSDDGASVVIPVVVPHGGGLGEDAQTVPFTIALADGAVTLPPPAQWEAALATTATVRADMIAAEAKWLAERKAPLTPPQGCEEQDWHEYLREAHGRLSTEPPFNLSTATTVLFARDHPRYRQSLKWLRDEVADVWDFPTNAAFASPCDPDGLVVAFTKAVKRLKPGSAVNATFWIAAPEPQFAAIARLVAPTGAKTVWIDLAAAIPQRPERIPGTPEHEAAMQAWSDSMDAEMAAD